MKVDTCSFLVVLQTVIWSWKPRKKLESGPVGLFSQTTHFKVDSELSHLTFKWTPTRNGWNHQSSSTATKLACRHMHLMTTPHSLIMTTCSFKVIVICISTAEPKPLGRSSTSCKHIKSAGSYLLFMCAVSFQKGWVCKILRGIWQI